VFCEAFGWLGFGTMIYSYFSPQFAEEFRSELFIHPIGMLILLVLLILLYLTRRYSLKEDKLALEFLWIPYFKIPYKDILGVGPYERELALAHSKEGVLIPLLKKGGKKKEILISPKNREDFVRSLERLVNHAKREKGI
jgi:hypothetical protein